MGSGRQLLYRRNRASPLIDLVDAIGNESALRVGGEGFRSESGEGMILEKNVFVERVLPGSVIRRLSEQGDGPLTAGPSLRVGPQTHAHMATDDSDRGQARRCDEGG